MASTKLPKDVARALLDKLASDDDFRTNFVADPGTALASLGFRPEEGVACFKAKKLASKEEIAEVRDEMQRMLVLGTLGQIPNKIDIGKPRH